MKMSNEKEVCDFPETDEEFFELNNNETAFYNFLLKNKLISSDKFCKNEECENKKENIKFCFVKGNPKLRCMNTNCKQYWSVRNEIFNLNSTSSLTLQEILTIYWYWANDHTARYAAHQLKISKATIQKWYQKIRSFLMMLQFKALPMGGPDSQAQIDESLILGKRKYNRGRMLKGDKKPKEMLKDRLRAYQLMSLKKKNKNYGSRVSGPWVFGIVCQKKGRIEEANQIQTIKKETITNYIKQFQDKAVRRNLYKDHRKLNNKSNRLYLNHTQYKFNLFPKKTCSHVRSTKTRC